VPARDHLIAKRQLRSGLRPLETGGRRDTHERLRLRVSNDSGIIPQSFSPTA